MARLKWTKGGYPPGHYSQEICLQRWGHVDDWGRIKLERELYVEGYFWHAIWRPTDQRRRREGLGIARRRLSDAKKTMEEYFSLRPCKKVEPATLFENPKSGFLKWSQPAKKLGSPFWASQRVCRYDLWDPASFPPKWGIYRIDATLAGVQYIRFRPEDQSGDWDIGWGPTVRDAKQAAQDDYRGAGCPKDRPKPATLFENPSRGRLDWSPLAKDVWQSQHVCIQTPGTGQDWGRFQVHGPVAPPPWYVPKERGRWGAWWVADEWGAWFLKEVDTKHQALKHAEAYFNTWRCPEDRPKPATLFENPAPRLRWQRSSETVSKSQWVCVIYPWVEALTVWGRFNVKKIVHKKIGHYEVFFELEEPQPASSGWRIGSASTEKEAKVLASNTYRDRPCLAITPASLFDRARTMVE